MAGKKPSFVGFVGYYHLVISKALLKSVDLEHNEVVASFQGREFILPADSDGAKKLKSQLETEDSDGLINEDVDILVSIRQHV